MVQHQIGHQGSAATQQLQIGPVPESWFELLMAGHGKAAITAGAQKRKHMHHRCQWAEVAVDHLAQGEKPWFVIPLQGVGIGDQNAGASAPTQFATG